METFGSSERFGTWIAKRATIILVLFVVWSWFVASPGTFSTAFDKTGAAWCAIAPCPSETENGQLDARAYLPDPNSIWSTLHDLRTGGDSVTDAWGVDADTTFDRAGGDSNE